MNSTGRVEPSLEPQSVEQWVAEVKPQDAESMRHGPSGATRSRSATPWFVVIGAAGAFALLMAFQQVVEGSVRDAPLKRARAERVVACGGADTSPTGTVCSELSSTNPPASSRRAAYAQLAR